MSAAEEPTPVASVSSNDAPKKQPTSVLKIEANRRNALKSTGPKIVAGKANSRKNAVKHGLFVRHMQDLPGENPRDFVQYFNRLWDDAQPVGPREEHEVEYIAICWLRLQRLWRYENAEIMSAQQSVRRHSETGGYDHLVGMPRPAKIISLLSAAESDVKANGQLSVPLMERIFDQDIHVQIYWPDFKERAEAVAKKNASRIAQEISVERKIALSQAKILLANQPMLQPEFVRFVLLETIRRVRVDLFERWNRLFPAIVQSELQRNTIPSSHRAMENIIRSGNAIERHMSRAYARLERLQLLRKGKPVPPPLSISFTS